MKSYNSCGDKHHLLQIFVFFTTLESSTFLLFFPVPSILVNLLRMIGRKTKSRHNRPQNTGANPSAKRQRQQLIEEPADILKITDLNDDCLEKIFDYLSLEELLNVADANKWLYVASASVYRRKFGQNKVILFELIANKTGYIRMGYQSTVIVGLKECLRFMRCFGPLISKLRVNYFRSSRKDYSYLDRYVNEFCAETLASIEYYQKPTSLMDIPEKPFTKTKNLLIKYSNLGNSLGEIVRWFPNLHSMQLLLNRIDGSSIEMNLPNLNLLQVRINSTNKYRIGHKNIAQAVHLNPQLRSLTIGELGRSQFPFKYILEIASMNPKITTLNVVPFKTSLNVVPGIIIKEEILDLVMALPLIEHLNLYPYCFQSDYVIEFITRAKHLKKFIFCIAETRGQQFQKLNAHLGDEWKCTNTDGYIKLERRN